MTIMTITSTTTNDSLRSDQELVGAVHADKNAYGAIVERYEMPLRRYLGRLGCHDTTDANDVLQEIFIKAFRHLNDYDPSLKFSSWLYRIAHNETITFFRKKSNRPHVLSMSADDAQDFFASLADETHPMSLAVDRDEAQLVQAALATLPLKYKEVLILRFLEEKSYTEIGDILKIPEGSVATLISRGKKLLQSALTLRGLLNS
jgi:RNA polymerase sigma-70 factor (ECF subfamily)